MFLKNMLNIEKLLLLIGQSLIWKRQKERQEIVEGLLIALKDIDGVINLIKKSKNKTEATEGLISKYKLTRKQAEAVLVYKTSTIDFSWSR